ncbi:cupin-like domain-containing protein [Candidatus Tisiphia endosymbiont of Micropterix aruncella]|uniref:cupin-like domain-containing protein n=1 Tax=Candidatus Tisiphia endosymbiont of Micropterix aruncella TaxID=3066271 RepID=UPI003AA9563D
MQNEYISIKNTQTISKAQFTTDYYESQKPLLIKQGATNWPAMTKWSEDYFIKTIGNSQVVLNEFKHTKEKIFRTILPPMIMEEAINIMRHNKDKTKKYSILRDSMVNHHPKLLTDVYDIPFLDTDIFYSKDFWFGDGGNVTSIHFDAADNFVISILGEKTFYLYHPSETYLLYPHNLITEGRFNFSQVPSRFLFDIKHYPLFTQAQCYKVTIKPGNILYIPSGWWHEVHTHNQRAVTVTYFFNKHQYPCLLWHFIGYQSCRLHEIKENEIVQELLYFTNYSNCFDNVYKLLAINQYWLAIILVGAMLENLIKVVTSQSNRKSLFDIIEQDTSIPICNNLIKTKNWRKWQVIIRTAMLEDNNKLKCYDLTKFIEEVQEFVFNNKYLISSME